MEIRLKRFLSLALAIMMVFSLMPQIAFGASAADTKTVYFQNNWLWTDVCIHYWGGSSATNWPGDAMTVVENDGNYDIYKAEIPAGTTGIIFNGIKNDGSGSRDQTPDITTIQTDVYYYMMWNDGNAVGTTAYNPSTDGGEEDTWEESTTKRTIYYSGSYTNAYVWNSVANKVSVAWPGAAMQQLDDGTYYIEVSESYDKIIFNDGSGQTEDLTIPTDGKNYYDNGAWTTYVPDAEEECKHNAVDTDVTKDPTCTETGLQNIVCADCGHMVEENVEIGPLGHTFVDESGNALAECSVCSEPNPDAEASVPEADSELTIPEANALGEAQDTSAYTADKYYVTGVITNVYNTTYGNMYIQDEDGNTLTVYGTYDADGTNRYDAMETQPVAGDTVKVYGIIGNYKGAPQMKNGWIVEHTPGEGAPEVELPEDGSTLTIAEVLELSDVLTGDTTEKYYVTGEIDSVYNTTYGNMYIKDEAGNTLTVYGTYSADGSTRYDKMETKPVAGDTVTVYGILSVYNGKAQVKNGWIVNHTAAACEHENHGQDGLCENCGVAVGHTFVDGECECGIDDTLTIPEANALGLTYSSNSFTTEKYYVTGVITEVYNTTYGNMYIKDDEGNTLTVYGTYSADGSTSYANMETQPVAGDTITVYGIIGQYGGTAQMKNGWIVAHTPAESAPAAPFRSYDEETDTESTNVDYNFACMFVCESGIEEHKAAGTLYSSAYCHPGEVVKGEDGNYTCLVTVDVENVWDNWAAMSGMGVVPANHEKPAFEDTYSVVYTWDVEQELWTINEGIVIYVACTDEEPEAPEIVIPETAPEGVNEDLWSSIVNDAGYNEAAKNFELPEGVESLTITLSSVQQDTETGAVKVSYDVTPGWTEGAVSITFRLPVTGSDTQTHVNVYHENDLMGKYEVQNEDGGLYVEITSSEFSIYTVEEIVEVVNYPVYIGEQGYDTFAEAMNAAKAMTGDVVVDIYGEVEFVNGMELNGSYTSITFNGKTDDAKITINQSAGGDYLEAHGKTVVFNDLILAKANPAWSGNSGHMGNYFSIQGGTVTYNNCTFPNGACTSTGTATYNSCNFQNASEYGLWVYDDALVTVNGGTIDSKKGIKVYSEGETSVTSTLTVQNATFTENVTAKPAVAIGYAQSINLIGNTYNNATGVLELDSGSDADCEGITFVAEDAEGNDISATLTAVDRSNSNAACGVLVDGKIYTTVTSAVAEVEEAANVTVLYSTEETAQFPAGSTVTVAEGVEAPNVTVAEHVPEGRDFTGYTSTDGIWGETWGNAIESFVIKVLDADGNVMGTTSLNNVDGIIDGNVEVTWNLKLDAESNTDEYWTMSWTTAPSMTAVPTTVELWVDGVKVSGGNVVLNGPDNINKIYAAEVDADGKITEYCNLDSFVSKIGDMVDRRIVVLRDVSFSSTNIRCVEFISGVEGGVTVTNTDTENWIDFDFVTVGKGVTVNVENPYSGDSENVIEGTLNAGDTYYHGYNAKTTIQNGGNVHVGGTTILRYNANADAGIYVYGDGNNETVEFDCDYYIGAYSGTFYAENANIETGYFLLKNSYDNSSYADIDMTLDGSSLTVVGTTDTQDSFIIDDQASLTLKNGSAIKDVRDFNILAGTNLTLSVDESSSISATYVNVAEGVGFEATKNEDGTVTFKKTLKGTGTEEDPILINDLADLILFRDTVNTYTQDGSNQFKGKYVKLTADIDLAGINWTPIGDNTTNDHESFQGIFDGDNHTISNLYVNSDGDHLGLFARVGSYAEGITPTVKNLKLHNVDVSSNTLNGHGGSYVGGVIANAGGNSVVSNVTVTGDVKVAGYGYVGGIVGHGYPDLTNCHVNANDGSYVKAYYWCAGGIIGYAGEGGTPIVNCSVSGLDIWSAYGAAAAVAGLLQDGNKVENVSASNVEITSNSDYCMGYIAGNGECSTLTNVTMENVTATANGKPITPTDAVATVGDAAFFDLMSAAAAAKEGDTIKLLSSTTIPAEQSITLNNVNLIAEEDVTLTTNKNFFISGNSTIQITNLQGRATVLDGTVLTDSYIKSTTNGTTRVLGDLTLNGGFEAAYFMTAGSNTENAGYEGTITIEEGTTVNVSYGVDVRGSATLNGGTIKLSGGNASGKLWGCVFQSGTFDINTDIVVEGLTGTYAPVHFTNATATVNGSITQSVSGGEPIYINAGSTVIFGADSVVTTDCSVHVSGNLECYGNVAGKITKAADTAEIIVLAGTYTQDVSDWCDTGYVAKDNGDGTWTVKAAVEAKIGRKSYETLKAAVEAAVEGDTILLQADVIVDEVLVVDHNITIADYSTYSITFIGEGAIHITENHNLTLDKVILTAPVYADSTTAGATIGNALAITGTSEYKSTVTSDGTEVVVKNPDWLIAVGDAYYMSLSAAVADAKPDDVITLLGDIELPETVVIDKALTVEGNGKKITGADDLIQIKADLTLNNVVIEAGKYCYALVIKADDCNVELNDCSITGPVKGYGTSSYIIKSGTYKKGNSAFSSMLNGAAVYGGIFYYEVPAQYCAPGYVPVDNGDGTWTVKYDPACFIDADNDGVLDEDEAVFGDLNALFAADLSGEVTVVLLRDAVAAQKVNTAEDTTYNFVTNVDGGVAMNFEYEDNWNYIRNMSIGENIALNVKYLVMTGDVEIAGTVDAFYPYISGGNVTVTETGTLTYEGGDALQVKNGATLTVNGTVNAPTINVWAGESKLVVSGENAKVKASWIDIWDGNPSVVVEDGATLDVDAIKASRGGAITVDNATMISENIELGHNGNSKGTMTVTGNSTISGIKLTVLDSTVAGPEGMDVTTTLDGYTVTYDNGVYKVVEIPEIQDGAILVENEDKVRITVDITAEYVVNSLKAELYDQNGELLTTVTPAFELGEVLDQTTLGIMIKGDSSSWDQTEWTPNAAQRPDSIKVYINGLLVAEVDVCGETNTEAALESLTQQAWEALVGVELFDITSSSIVLGNELAMYFYVSNEDLEGEDYVAVVTKSYADGRADVVVEIPFSDWEDTTNDRKRFKFDGIAAKEMNDIITVVIKTASTDEVVSNPYNDSIKGYVARGFVNGNINESNRELGTMLIDMLNYGAAAQEMFGYNVEHPANEGMEAYQSYATQSITLTNKQEKGTGYRSMSAVLESNISLIMFFEKAHVTTDMTAVVTFTDHYGHAHEIQINGADFEDRGAKGWGIVVDELVVADGCQLVTCKFLDANGNEVEGVYGTDSLESMCARAVAGGGGDWYEYIMKFSASAYNYFH